MADRKSQSITFKLPCTAFLRELKNALTKENSSAELTVIQDLGGSEFLVEFAKKKHAEEFTDSSIDFNEIHIQCHPPHGYYINVSIIGLCTYVPDYQVVYTLQDFGEIKGDIIRLKYQTDHELTGLENGNRLARMVLMKPSVPYSLKIISEWCRIIYNNQ